MTEDRPALRIEEFKINFIAKTEVAGRRRTFGQLFARPLFSYATAAIAAVFVGQRTCCQHGACDEGARLGGVLDEVAIVKGNVLRWIELAQALTADLNAIPSPGEHPPVPKCAEFIWCHNEGPHRTLGLAVQKAETSRQLRRYQFT